MIAFKIGTAPGQFQFLELPPNISVGIEVYNPLFGKDGTPGTLTYPVNVPISKPNQRLLGFPEELSNEVSIIEWPSQLYIENVLWKIGVMRYLGCDSKNYKLSFKSDAGDFAARTRDVSLQSIDYGTVPLYTGVSGVYPDAAYAFCPVKNTGFYDKGAAPADKNATYAGYQNYFSGGVLDQTAGKYAITPFPFLRYLLDKIFLKYDYQLAGDWLEEDYVKRLVIYNNYHLQGNVVDLRNHVPDVKVGELLQALRNLFALAYVFDATGKKLNIVRLKDIVTNPAYQDWTHKAEKLFSSELPDTNGYTLQQTLESNDELNKTLTTDWSQLKVGAGREQITTTASTLHMIREQDAVTTSRRWLVPATELKGTDPGRDTGDNSFSLRLLSYYGLHPDSQGNTYPLGSAISENYAGGDLGGRSLQYAGPRGLYQNNWQEWLAFLSDARPIERNVRLTMEDLMNLEPTRKIQIDGVRMFYEKISLSVSGNAGIGKAKGSFLKVSI